MKKLAILSVFALTTLMSGRVFAAEIPAANGSDGVANATYDSGSAGISRAAIAAGVAVVAAVAAIAIIDNNNSAHSH